MDRRNPDRDRHPPAYLADYELGAQSTNNPDSRTEENPPVGPVPIPIENQGEDEYPPPAPDDPDYLAWLEWQGGQRDNVSVGSGESKRTNRSTASAQQRRLAQLQLDQAIQLVQLNEELDDEATAAEFEAFKAKARIEKIAKKKESLKEVSQLMFELEKSKIADGEDDDGDTRTLSGMSNLSPIIMKPNVNLDQTHQWVQGTSKPQTFNLTAPKLIMSKKPPVPKHISFESTPHVPNIDPNQLIPPPQSTFTVQDPFVPNISSTPSVPQQFQPTQLESHHQPVLTYRKYPDLPYFGGDVKEWPVFLANFNQSTKMYGIPPVFNLARLQKALKGEAKNVVHALLLHERNLPRIMEALERRFGRDLELIQQMMDEVKKFSSLREGQYKQLLEFSDHISNMTAMINSFDLPEYLHNPLLLQEILDKLPFSFQSTWAKKVGEKKIVPLDVFEEWFKEETKTLVRYVKVTSSCSTQVAQHENKNRFRGPRAVVHATSEPQPLIPGLKENKPQPRQPPPWLKCAYCDKSGHKIWTCPDLIRDPISTRRNKVFAKKLCFGCLGRNHILKDCQSKRVCPEPNCGKEEDKLLHEHPRKSVTATFEPSPTTGQMLYAGGEIANQIVPVYLRNGRNETKVYAMLDTASDFTLLDQSIATRLKLTGRSEPIGFDTLAGSTRAIKSQNCKLQIVNIGSGEVYEMDEVRIHPQLPELKRGTVTRKMLERWPHLKKLVSSPSVFTFENVRPMMLIGLPHAHLITPFHVVRPEKNGPVAAQTPLGWTIFGQLSLPDSTQRLSRNYLIQAPQVLHASMSEPKEIDNDLKVHKLVESFFLNESLGIQPRAKEDSSPEVRKALDVANSTLRRVNDRFEIGLLWKSDEPQFPNNLQSAMVRLRSQEKKMDKDPAYAKKYCDNMNSYIEKGYLRKLSPEEAAIPSPITWYLPHFSVVNPQKPDKMRMVLDAAAVTDGTSFNSQLLPGPDILKPLPGILCQFREKKIGLAADIKEMFHQVLIRKEDQQAQRILWRGMSRDIEPEVYVMTVMIFGATCSPFCAQFVKNFNAEQHVDQYPKAVSAIINNHYVDDLLCSADTEEEAFGIYKDVSEVHARGGFTICNWISNSPTIIKSVPVDMRSKSLKTFTGKEELENEKVLGLVWNPQLDQFKFNTAFAKVPPSILSGHTVPSRRQILSTVMSVYDPLGFAANVSIKAKLLIQKCWKLGIGWDDPITDTLFEQWKEWLKLVKEISQFSISRCYSPSFSQAQEIQLHVFCDASDQAYGTVAYFRITSGSGVETNLIGAKSKVLPIKQTFKENVSVPRAELQAAVLGTRLANSIIEWHQKKPQRIVFWSDNTTVLQWLNMDHSRLKQFVSNRVAEIQDTTKPEQWKYVPTDLNVADDVTKSNIPVSFDPESRWNRGPDFLKLNEDDWPKMATNAKPDESAIRAEMKKEFVGSLSGTTPKLIDFNRFSRYSRVVRVMARVRRALDLMKQIPYPKYLTTHELEKAENSLMKLAQQESYPELIKLYQSEKPRSVNREFDIAKVKKELKLDHLSLFFDESDGLIKMKGRVQHPVLGANVEANPILLSPNHPLTRLIIHHHHKELLHQGREALVNIMKAKFCILHVREAVKKVISNCQVCKNNRSVPKPPEMAPLPPCRTATYSRPFSHTGVDYFGPMMVAIGRRNEKRWGVIFTCMTTRAIHVDLAVDLSADGFINCLRRFISDRACPTHMYSDNGTNFVGAEAELKAELQKLLNEEEKIQDFVNRYRMTWKFIPPHSPHMGGCWERMVRSVKSCLLITLKERKPKEDTLRTFLKEAQAVVNTHPLGYVSSDQDAEEVLTPNHFLFGSSSIMPIPGVFDDKDFMRARQWKIVQRLADHFWRRWIKEVLPILNPRMKWLRPQTPLKIGDIVIVLDENSPRCSWPKGKIISLKPGEDGQTRQATIQTANGIFTRPTTKIAVLDVLPKHEPDDGNEEINEMK